MKILAFDISGNKAFINISENNNILASKIIENTKLSYNSALLIPVIIELLQDQKLNMSDIDALGVNIGPGSFTGIRVSATIARIISQHLDMPVVGVSSLEIISLINNTSKNSLCLFDAKRSKVYIGEYSPQGDIILEPGLLECDEAIKYASTKDFFLISDTKIVEKLSIAGINSINLDKENYNFGNFLTELTYKYLSKGNIDKYKWYNLKPLYVQSPPITMPVQKVF